MLQNKHSVLSSNKEIIMKCCKGHDNSGMSTLWLYCDMARIGITPRQIPLKLKWKYFSEMGPYRGRKIGDNWCMMPGYDGRYGMDGNSWLRWMCDDRSVRYGMLVIKSGPYFCMRKTAVTPWLMHWNYCIILTLSNQMVCNFGVVENNCCSFFCCFSYILTCKWSFNLSFLHLTNNTSV